MSVKKGELNYTQYNTVVDTDTNNIYIPIENSLLNTVITGINWGFVPLTQPYNSALYDTEFNFATLSIFRNEVYDDAKQYFMTQNIAGLEMLFADTISQPQENLFRPRFFNFARDPIQIDQGDRGLIVINSLVNAYTPNSLGVYVIINAYQTTESVKHRGSFPYATR